MLDRVSLKLLAVLAYDADSDTSDSPLDDDIVGLNVWQNAHLMPVADFPFDATYNTPMPRMSQQVSYPVPNDIASGRHGAAVSPCSTTLPPIFLWLGEMTHLYNHWDIHPAIQPVQTTGKRLPRGKVVAKTQEKIEDDARTVWNRLPRKKMTVKDELPASNVVAPIPSSPPSRTRQQSVSPNCVQASDTTEHGLFETATNYPLRTVRERLPRSRMEEEFKDGVQSCHTTAHGLSEAETSLPPQTTRKRLPRKRMREVEIENDHESSQTTTHGVDRADADRPPQTIWKRLPRKRMAVEVDDQPSRYTTHVLAREADADADRPPESIRKRLPRKRMTVEVEIENDDQPTETGTRHGLAEADTDRPLQAIWKRLPRKKMLVEADDEIGDLHSQTAEHGSLETEANRPQQAIWNKLPRKRMVTQKGIEDSPQPSPSILHGKRLPRKKVAAKGEGTEGGVLVPHIADHDLAGTLRERSPRKRMATVTGEIEDGAHHFSSRIRLPRKKVQTESI